jgi:hypothetical protein
VTQFIRKVCKDCGVEKVRCRQFYKHPTCRDGYMRICKVCHRRNVLANKAIKREHYRALGRKQDQRRREARRRYEQLPHVRERIRRYRRENYRLDKLEMRA